MKEHNMPTSFQQAADPAPAIVLDLRLPSPAAWLDAVLGDFDNFLIDHAQAEKKASQMAMSMLQHYPDKPQLVSAMVDLALEELAHFREVVKLVFARGLTLPPDTRDAYVGALRKAMATGREQWLLDRLLVAAIVEKRGYERFGLVAEALTDSQLQRFYHSITRSEKTHFELFLNLAGRYFPDRKVSARMNELLDIEADIVAALPIRAALH